ncbi:MAG: phosphoribosylglycinamide formyltransferase [Candidatus Kapaibacteriota bacterium]
MKKLRLAVFASHEGTNMQSIIDAIVSGELAAEVVCVISNNSNAGALVRASKAGIKTYHISSQTHPNEIDFINAILNVLESNKVDLIILAGYMKIMPKEIIKKYQNKILNIHPALLPKFGGKGMYGMNVHKAVIESGETKSGVTVHLVDEFYDNGRILHQVEVPVLPDDTPETLQKRVLAVEHKVYVETLKKIINGTIIL